MIIKELKINNRAGVDILATYIGKLSLPYNSFTLGVSEFLAKKGKITPSQREALLSTYDD